MSNCSPLPTPNVGGDTAPSAGTLRSGGGEVIVGDPTCVSTWLSFWAIARPLTMIEAPRMFTSGLAAAKAVHAARSSAVNVPLHSLALLAKFARTAVCAGVLLLMGAT